MGFKNVLQMFKPFKKVSNVYWEICIGKRDMCPLSYRNVVNVIKVRRQKDICMGKRQKDVCAFRYWRAREGNSDCRGKFHQSVETKKKKKKKKKKSVEAQALSRFTLKNQQPLQQ